MSQHEANHHSSNEHGDRRAGEASARLLNVIAAATHATHRSMSFFGDSVAQYSVEGSKPAGSGEPEMASEFHGIVFDQELHGSARLNWIYLPTVSPSIGEVAIESRIGNDLPPRATVRWGVLDRDFLGTGVYVGTTEELRDLEARLLHPRGHVTVWDRGREDGLRTMLTISAIDVRTLDYRKQYGGSTTLSEATEYMGYVLAQVAHPSQGPMNGPPAEQ